MLNQKSPPPYFFLEKNLIFLQKETLFFATLFAATGVAGAVCAGAGFPISTTTVWGQILSSLLIALILHFTFYILHFTFYILNFIFLHHLTVIIIGWMYIFLLVFFIFIKS